MAKFTDRGWGKEEDPMFLEGLKLSYTQKLEKSTSATPKSMDGKPQPKPRKLRVPNGAKVRGVDLIRQVGPIPERGQEITVTYCGAVRDRAALDRLNLELGMPLFVMRVTFGLATIYLSLCSYREKKTHAGSNLEINSYAVEDLASNLLNTIH